MSNIWLICKCNFIVEGSFWGPLSTSIQTWSDQILVKKAIHASCFSNIIMVDHSSRKPVSQTLVTPLLLVVTRVIIHTSNKRPYISDGRLEWPLLYTTICILQGCICLLKGYVQISKKTISYGYKDVTKYFFHQNSVYGNWEGPHQYFVL